MVETPRRIDGHPLSGFRPQDDIALDRSKLSPELVELLRHGNIAEIRQKIEEWGVNKVELEKFIASQHRSWTWDVVKEQLYTSPFSQPAPEPEDFAVHNPAIVMDEGDTGLLNSAFGKVMSLKTFKGVGKTGEGNIPEVPEVDIPLDYNQLGGDLVEAADELNNRIIENAMWSQMQAAVEANKQKLQDELNRIIAMVKSGQISEELLLAALAKVSVTSQGILLTHVGRRIWHHMDKSKRATEKLSDLTNPAELTKVTAGERATQVNITMDTNLLNQITAKIGSTMETFTSMMRNIKSDRDQMRSHIALR